VSRWPARTSGAPDSMPLRYAMTFARPAANSSTVTSSPPPLRMSATYNAHKRSWPGGLEVSKAKSASVSTTGSTRQLLHLQDSHIAISRAGFTDLPASDGWFKRATRESTRRHPSSPARYLCVRIPAILTHRIAAHPDAVGVVNQPVDDANNSTDQVACWFIDTRL